jgi:rhodanese-related sulfurtransferase
MQQWLPAQLQSHLDAGKKIQLLDVREDDERAFANIGGVHIPMREILQRVGELEVDVVTVVYCHHGRRSAQVAGLLLQQGFETVINLKGGIDRWSEDVDNTIKQY